jgi:hypothetical protein
LFEPGVESNVTIERKGKLEQMIVLWD